MRQTSQRKVLFVLGVLAVAGGFLFFGNRTSDGQPCQISNELKFQHAGRMWDSIATRPYNSAEKKERDQIFENIKCDIDFKKSFGNFQHQKITCNSKYKNPIEAEYITFTWAKLRFCRSQQIFYTSEYK